MRYKNKPTDLPFVGRTTPKERLSFWTISNEGTFSSGATLGEEMAVAFAKYLSASPGQPAMLPQIVIDMLNVGELQPGLHGQIVGFFSALEVELTRSPP